MAVGDTSGVLDRVLTLSKQNPLGQLVNREINDSLGGQLSSILARGRTS